MSCKSSDFWDSVPCPIRLCIEFARNFPFMSIKEACSKAGLRLSQENLDLKSGGFNFDTLS